MRRFVAKGGRPGHEAVSRQAPRAARGSFDLVAVYPGKGGLSEVFERDRAHTLFESPAAAGWATVIIKASASGKRSTYVTLSSSTVIQIGEFLSIPLLPAGPAAPFVFEATHGAQMDVWGEVDAPTRRSPPRSTDPQILPQDCRTTAKTSGRLPPWLKGAITQWCARRSAGGKRPRW